MVLTYKDGTSSKDKELASIFKEECIDLIRLFFLRCGLLSILFVILIEPTFSEIEATNEIILFVME